MNSPKLGPSVALTQVTAGAIFTPELVRSPELDCVTAVRRSKQNLWVFLRNPRGTSGPQATWQRILVHLCTSSPIRANEDMLALR